ncbi:MAG: hypothetical protein JKY95_16895 [Planctomycetaceae bacterium]|nr:hypothetical protein [Planctomycetaceae bacterium]
MKGNGLGHLAFRAGMKEEKSGLIFVVIAICHHLASFQDGNRIAGLRKN